MFYSEGDKPFKGISIKAGLMELHYLLFLEQETDAALEDYVAMVKQNMGLETEVRFDPDKKGVKYIFRQEGSWMIYLTHSGLVVDGENKDAGDIQIVNLEGEFLDVNFTRLGDDFVAERVYLGEESQKIRGKCSELPSLDVDSDPFYMILKQSGVADFTLDFVVKPAILVFRNNDLMGLTQTD